MRKQQHKRGPIDWSQIRARLAEAEARAQAAQEISEPRGRELMEERARWLARAGDAADTGACHEVLTFGLGLERYCVETKYAREVARFVDYTPVPGTPDFVVGVTNVRGEVICVIDLRKLFRVPTGGLTDQARLIALGGESTELGIVADQTFEVSELRAADILPAPESSGVAHGYLLGVTRDATIVLDGQALLRDPKLTIEHGDT